VSIASVEDMHLLMQGIPLDKVSVSMTINATATTLLTYLVAVAEERGLDPKLLTGTVQNDILKEYMARGTYIYPPRPSMRLITDLFAWCNHAVPKWNTISISGYHVREAGCDAAQEIAFTLGDGIAYVEAAIAAGLDVDSFADRLAFFFNGHNNFLEEIAKFRAARRLWARLMRERYGAKTDAACKLRTHAQTAGVSLTAQQPVNNVARVALQALAAVLGGVQSLHTNSMDETLSLPTEDAVRVALRTQQIIAEESGVTNTVDPLGGSYYIERLTNEIESEALEYIKQIDALGGMLKAVEIGFPQKEIAEAAYQFQLDVDAKEQCIVGVNKYKEGGEQEIPTLKIDHAAEKKQVERIKAYKARRDPNKHKAALASVKSACVENRNVVPVLIDAVQDGVTLGEVSDIYREVFGVYSDPGML
jgi:methylmalonyl-CoA mutase N-terminal domain/subunit